MSINSDPFAFLSYFKILNIAYPNGQGQMDWINNNLAGVWYGPAVDRVNELRSSIADIGNYLYVQGRCAVAHANGTPLVNPDNYADKRRLFRDLPLMKEVAALFIERELGVLTDSTFWQKHRDARTTPPDLLRRLDGPEGYIAYVQAERGV